MKTGYHLSLFAVVSFALAAIALPSCGGDGFSAREGSAGGGGGRSNGEAGDGNAAGESGSGGVEAGGSSGQGQAGDGMGGVNAGRSPEATGGLGGTTQGGSGGGGSPATGGFGGLGGKTQGGSGGGGSSAIGVKAFDDFVASAEGWTVTGDDTTKTVKYSSTGGKPNGSISAEEATTGTLFFTAPQKYLGDVSAYYGGRFRFDLKAGPTNGDFFAYADVELTSNLVTLAYDCTPNPTTAWQSYVVPLNEAGWKMTSITGAAVTAAQFKAVLANLTRVRIRGEFSNEYDIGYLDNVYLGSQAGGTPAQ